MGLGAMKEKLPAGGQKKGGISMEEALMELVGIGTSGKEMGKGIPFVSFVVKEGEGAVFIKPLPLSAADGILKGQEAAGSKKYLGSRKENGRGLKHAWTAVQGKG